MLYACYPKFTSFFYFIFTEIVFSVTKVNLSFADEEWKDKSSGAIEIIENMCTRCPR